MPRPQPNGHTFPGLDFATEGTWRGPYFFIQIADPQLGMFDQDAHWDRELALVEKGVAAINRLRPRFVAICGDEVNQFPGGPEYARQVADVKQALDRIDPSIPLMYMCGNHDIGDRPDAASLGLYRAHFGDDRYDPTDLPDEQQRQEAWLAETLVRAAAHNPRHILLLQHHPWFLDGPDDADQYFTIPRIRRDPALALLKQHNVRAAFAGHYHRNAHGWDGNFEMVTSSAIGMPLGQDPSGLRVVEVYADRIAHRYYGVDDVPPGVALQLG
jgi:3',5'-cyclic AMP phosphodiesterase CpdA